ncbi:MAG: ABC transporter ATP-binding protein [Calditrichaeota bacterium]|nr:MAG: ABC transporter ATP-binding protein [Calditrichota bacterium]
MLQIERLVVSYGGDPVINDFSLQVPEGSFVGLVGPNGAGKTTLMLAASGQLQPASGQVHFGGEDVYAHNLRFKRRMGFVHEEPFFYPQLTVAEFMRFVAEVKRIPAGKQEDEVAARLETVMWREPRSKRVADLSMGMRKKLAIAAAMLAHPRILFLDEALNGIDIESAFQIKSHLKTYAREGGIVILSTHVLDVVEKLCTRYLILQNGRVLSDLDAAEFADLRENGRAPDLESYIMELLHGASGPGA